MSTVAKPSQSAVSTGPVIGLLETFEKVLRNEMAGVVLVMDHVQPKSRTKVKRYRLLIQHFSTAF